jgi:hypothetical protein
MRVPFVVALLVSSIAGIIAANAADLPVGHSAGYFSTNSQRAGLLVTYDDQPGIVVRPYWYAPWHSHHYFPFSRIRPRLSAIGPRPKLARTFHRSWSNAWTLEHALPPQVEPPSSGEDKR